mmetsp:Transcript_29452/g.63591  ORF Transcript_29452/g.63591 Transcript_29452/m.63591 type:complete len:215 (-) Transcript_29452:78-722(-)
MKRIGVVRWEVDAPLLSFSPCLSIPMHSLCTLYAISESPLSRIDLCVIELHPAVCPETIKGRAGTHVEVSTHHHTVRVVCMEGCGQRFEKKETLGEFDVTSFWIEEEVCVSNNQSFRAATMFQHNHLCYIVAVDAVSPVSQGLICQFGEEVVPPSHGTAILLLSRALEEATAEPEAFQSRGEEVRHVFDFLKQDDVGIPFHDLLQQKCTSPFPG